MLDLFRSGGYLLSTLEVRGVEFSGENEGEAQVELGIPGEEEVFSFEVGLFRQSTPLAIKEAVRTAQGFKR